MTPILCPLCRHPLQRDAKTWRCATGHSFDVAREGYVNLLPVQHKASRDPGDDPQMVAARRDFLQAGHYQPLRHAVIALLSAARPSNLLDIGCGEGYYSSGCAAICDEVIGLDISRAAIRLAARRFPAVTWLVGSGALLPIADASLDAVCNIFTQLHVDEMWRVLKPGGRLLVVTPAPAHLWTLREQLFDVVRAYDADKFLGGLASQFALQTQQTLRVPLQLQQPALDQLLQMTPYAWRAKPERRAALQARDRFETEAVFNLLLLQRRASAVQA